MRIPSVRIGDGLGWGVGCGGGVTYNESAKMSARLVQHAVVRVRYIVCLGRESRDSTVYHGAPSTI